MLGGQVLDTHQIKGSGVGGQVLDTHHGDGLEVMGQGVSVQVWRVRCWTPTKSTMSPCLARLDGSPTRPPQECP